VVEEMVTSGVISRQDEPDSGAEAEPLNGYTGDAPVI